MREVRKCWLAVVLFLCVPGWDGVHADVGSLHITVDPYAGFAIWDQPIELKDDGVFGGRAGLMLGRWIGAEGHYGFSPTELQADADNDVLVTHYGGDLVLRLPPFRTVKPYLVGGWTAVSTNPDAGETQSFNGWEWGGGLLVPLHDRVSLRLDGRDVQFKRDQPLPNAGYWNHNIIVSAGLQFSLFGSRRDSDRDGVPDGADRCPDTPAGALVDATGCSRDSDGDGVVDGLDRCANTPSGARVDRTGCPSDSDRDGVPDGIDACENTAAGLRVDARGCPVDTDGDGVTDDKDRCENTPKGAVVDAAGCPKDSDNDGVPDCLDLCANSPKNARVDIKGCPIEVTDKETQLLDTGLLRLNDIQFETAKWALRSQSHAALDEVGRILSDWPELRIEIGGHTDSQGSDAYNQDLSQKRAQAVLDYIASKFSKVKKSQYTVTGYGESQPIADNGTDIGRAQNRRVEFKVLNKDAVKREIERRRLLKKDEKK